jgi:hypothetical protein
MEPKQPFAIIYAPIICIPLRVIEARYYSRIRTTIEQRLSYEPDVQSRQRKPLKRLVFFDATGNFDSEPGIGFECSTTLTKSGILSPSSPLGSNAVTGS